VRAVRRRLPLLGHVHRAQDRGLLVVGQHEPAASKSKIKPFASQYRFTFPTVLDPDNVTHLQPGRRRLRPRSTRASKTYAGYRTVVSCSQARLRCW
jgi:hypothetical protein